MKHTIVLVLLLLVVLGGCGRAPSTNTKKTTKITVEQINAVMENQIFECSPVEGFGCPGGIARLLILDKEDAEKSAVCTGFMVNEDTLVTNHHCVSTLTQCRNTHVAIYNGYTYEKTKCKSIVKALIDYKKPGDPRKKTDVAILKVENRYYGRTFKPASQKPSYDEIVTAWVVDHTGIDKKESNLFEARITEFKCKIGHNPGRQALILEKCPAVHGNSGSPVVNEEGKLIGIIWGATADINSSYDLTKRRAMDEQAAVTEIEIFSKYFSQN